MKIKSKRIISEVRPVFDLEVNEQSHCFCLASGQVVHNSKDIMDAVCGSVWSCYNNLEIATVMSSKHRIEAQNDYIKNKLTQGVGTALQDQLNGLY